MTLGEYIHKARDEITKFEEYYSKGIENEDFDKELKVGDWFEMELTFRELLWLTLSKTK